MKKILFIEDDKDISEMLCNYLCSENFEVEVAYNGKQAIGLYKIGKFDLLLIDLMLPGFSGFEIIKEIRKKDAVPIIIITAKDSDMHKTMGFNLGADDYVTKPFSLAELLARIKSNIRRVTQYNVYIGNPETCDEILTVKDLKINIDRHSVYRYDEEVKLTLIEFKILKLLASNKGRAFSKEQIYNSVWEEPYYGDENVLNAHINRLRNKLKNPYVVG